MGPRSILLERGVSHLGIMARISSLPGSLPELEEAQEATTPAGE